MSPFADTNWLVALYLQAHPQDADSVSRAAIAERRTRKESFLRTSHIVLLEARNVFSRATGEAHPREWEDLVADFNGRVFVDPMNWDLLRRETNRMFELFSHRATLGTFDVAIVASAHLAGAREILSFDERLKALAIAVGIGAFPPLSAEGRGFLATLRRK
ncbi:MAG TPA: PIN domain-containing protein [Verrucomicrobiae bacterium]|nr:PIN domain-containing protein [Verrucomicrobiae bacterium]